MSASQQSLLLRSIVSLGLIFAAVNCGRSSDIEETPRSIAEAAPKSFAFVGFDTCASHTLRLDFDTDGSATKESLLETLRILGTQPRLRLQSHPTEVGASLLVGLSTSCATIECAHEQGWQELQLKVAALAGVSISCGSVALLPAGEEPSCPAAGANGDQPKQDQQKQEEPKQDQPKQDSPKDEPVVGGGN